MQPRNFEEDILVAEQRLRRKNKLISADSVNSEPKTPLSKISSQSEVGLEIVCLHAIWMGNFASLKFGACTNYTHIYIYILPKPMSMHAWSYCTRAKSSGMVVIGIRVVRRSLAIAGRRRRSPRLRSAIRGTPNSTVQECHTNRIRTQQLDFADVLLSEAAMLGQSVMGCVTGD